MAKLTGKRIAVLATDGVEQVELVEPVEALREAGAETTLLSLRDGRVQGFNHLDKGDEFAVDATVAGATVDDYDGLLVPGGVANPDAMRADADAVAFVRDFAASGKPMGLICHAPWMLVEADVARGRTVTSFPSLQTDLRNAGATWVDREVVVDEGIVTSRRPDDIPAFSAKLIEEIAEGRHERAAAPLQRG